MALHKVTNEELTAEVRSYSELIAARVKAYMKAHDIKNVDALTAVASIKRSTAFLLLSGKSNPRIKTLLAVCRTFGVSLLELLRKE